MALLFGSSFDALQQAAAQRRSQDDARFFQALQASRALQEQADRQKQYEANNMVRIAEAINNQRRLNQYYQTQGQQNTLGYARLAEAQRRQAEDAALRRELQGQRETNLGERLGRSLNARYDIADMSAEAQAARTDATRQRALDIYAAKAVETQGRDPDEVASTFGITDPITINNLINIRNTQARFEAVDNEERLNTADALNSKDKAFQESINYLETLKTDRKKNDPTKLAAAKIFLNARGIALDQFYDIDSAISQATKKYADWKDTAAKQSSKLGVSLNTESNAYEAKLTQDTPRFDRSVEEVIADVSGKKKTAQPSSEPRVPVFAPPAPPARREALSGPPDYFNPAALIGRTNAPPPVQTGTTNVYSPQAKAAIKAVQDRRDQILMHYRNKGVPITAEHALAMAIQEFSRNRQSAQLTQ